jgi:hypothetical protein
MRLRVGDFDPQISGWFSPANDSEHRLALFFGSAQAAFGIGRDQDAFSRTGGETLPGWSIFRALPTYTFPRMTNPFSR